MEWTILAPAGALVAGLAFGFLMGRSDGRLASKVLVQSAQNRVKRARLELPAASRSALQDLSQAIEDLDDVLASIGKGRRS